MTVARILGIDPGTTQSAFCVIDTLEGIGAATPLPVAFAIAENEQVAEVLRSKDFPHPLDACVIEMVECFGMPVGREVFRTLVWIGRFEAAWETVARSPVIEVGRKAVVSHHCGSARGKDANVRQALIDRYGGEGGKRAAVGLKKSPGPLYGIAKDAWSALAIALWYADTQAEEKPWPTPNSSNALRAGCETPRSATWF